MHELERKRKMINESESNIWFKPELPPNAKILELSFDEIEILAKEKGVHIETMGFGWIRWQHLTGLGDYGASHARVGALKLANGSERVFTFESELENLNNLLLMENQMPVWKNK
ncbi:MAG TPA: hypothetical protein VIK81_00140 [Patescibacteria group bacterium]